jgi:AraC-like DNA-binding protein
MKIEAPARWEVTDDVDMFSDMLHKSYMPFAVAGPNGGLDVFSATVREQPLGRLRLVDGVMSPHGGIRRPRQVSATSRDVVGLQYVLAGRELIARGDDRHALGPGDVMLWDSDTSGAYEIVETVCKRTLVLPRSLALVVLPEFYSPATLRVIASQGATSVRPLFDVLAVLSDRLPTMSPQATEKAAALVIQMLADLGGGSDPTALGHRGGEDFCERVLAYVEDNLGDPGLSPAAIAAAHFVSIRTLYSALEPMNIALAAHIRARRLAHTYADLVTTDEPVGDIAIRWGFVSMSHFSRAFAKQYGFTPSRARVIFAHD